MKPVSRSWKVALLCPFTLLGLKVPGTTGVPLPSTGILGSGVWKDWSGFGLRGGLFSLGILR